MGHSRSRRSGHTAFNPYRGVLGWAVVGVLGIGLPFLYMLLFGAIISPTDPIATLAILKSVGLPQRLETVINGESLFNDGIAMVLVTVLSGLIYAGSSPSAGTVALMFAREVLGGAILGAVAGAICNFLLNGVREHSSQVIITLATVTGGFYVAQCVEVSGPISIVAAGLIVGNFSKVETSEDAGRQDLDIFWKMIDEVLDVILFVLIGMLVIVLDPTRLSIVAGVIMVPVVLLARWSSVAALHSLAEHSHTDRPPDYGTWSNCSPGVDFGEACLWLWLSR